jgi:hypothetical protein
MALVRRLAAIVSLVLVGLVAFSATTIAVDLRSLTRSSTLRQAGGGFGLLAAGTYQNSNVGAGFFACCGSDGATSFFLNVTHTKSLANPLVGSTTSTDEIDVNFSLNDFITGQFINGCIIADRSSDFTVNQLLSFAQLKTTVLGTTKTCGPLTGVTPPFEMSATWSMSASTRQSTSLASYTCGGYSSDTQTSGSGSSNGSATFSATFLTSPIPPAFGSAFIFSFKQSIHVMGVAPDGCIPLGGKGAGPGPGGQAPGDYSSSSISASMSVQPDDPSQQPFSVFVTSFTNTAHPVGQPISTQSETDLNLFQFSFFQFVQECWVIPPADFTMASDLHTASLNVSIDTTTQACQFATNTGPSVFTINATWTATSPVANLSTTSQGGCHVSGKAQQSAATATAVGSWPGTAASINDTNAFLSTNNSTTHVQPGGC